jgi:hypothetical protein
MGKVNAFGVGMSVIILLIVGYAMDLLIDETDFQRLQLPFLLATVTFVIALFFMILLVLQPAVKLDEDSSLVFSREMVGKIWNDRIFRRFLFISIIYQISMSGLWPLLPFVHLTCGIRFSF